MGQKGLGKPVRIVLALAIEVVCLVGVGLFFSEVGSFFSTTRYNMPVGSTMLILLLVFAFNDLLPYLLNILPHGEPLPLKGLFITVWGVSICISSLLSVAGFILFVRDYYPQEYMVQMMFTVLLPIIYRFYLQPLEWEELLQPQQI